MLRLLLVSLLSSLTFLQCDKKALPAANSVHKPEGANRLISESSPYLLQHAYNPVDWHPWGEAALSKAADEDKLLIISVGYAACHWCHVMEHESFEDTTVASIMNDNFVSIKVDREERPDVDDVYMTAAELINGRGGWPLNAIAMPDGKPIFAGTYYTKEQWTRILNRFIDLMKSDPEKLKQSAEDLTKGISESNVIDVNTNPLEFSKDELSAIVNRGLQKYDKKYGGRKGAPKFPMPNAFEFLMKYHFATADQKALETTLNTMDKMAMGGIYDHLGGGFARYSTDEKWLVPHFEKMLYDNGQMVSIYAQAYKLTKNPLYENVIRETIDFIERELMSEKSGFYSSLDADSEGEEGKFYIWQEEEIDQSLTAGLETDLFKYFYDVSKNGNWEHSNILNQVKSIDKAASKYELKSEEVIDILRAAKVKLLEKRAERIRPPTDDKVLTSWNALMLDGYLNAYEALGDAAYLNRALTNGQFIIDMNMSEDGSLLRNHKDGKSNINAFLDDYALTIHAFLKMYQVTFDIKWIDKSRQLADYAIEYFYNRETKMFDYTSKLDPPLVAKKAEYNDNVIPASNSSMARSLHRLGSLTYDKELIAMSEQMLNNMLPQLKKAEYLSFYSNWLQLALDVIYPPYEIAITGKDAMVKRKEMSANYLGSAVFLGTEKDENLALLKGKLMDDATMIFVCQNKVCKLPVEEVKEALSLAQYSRK